MTDGETSAMAPMVVNGWSIYAYPIFLDQLEGLIKEVEERKRRDPKAWQKKNCTKRLAAVFKLVGQDIPADPGAPQFRQGGTLGDDRKHWFRAKFFQQYRLFYRFKRDAKVIVLAWVNDEKTLRAYGGKNDAYATFRGMLDGGNPPDDFDALMKEAAEAAGRFEEDLNTGSLSAQG
jgi:toxin YhaV